MSSQRDEFVEPTGAGGLLRIHAEPVSALLEQVELRRALCREPALDDARLSLPEERIIGGDRDEQRRRIGRNGHGGDGPVDVADEGRFRVLSGNGRRQRQHGAGREADHADAVRIDVPFRRAAADQGKGGAGVLELRSDRRRHRLGSGRPGRPSGSAGEHLLHGLFEAGHVCRRLHEPVLQHECRDPLGGERLGDVRSFILHGKGAEAPAGRHHHCGPGRVGRIRQIGSQRGDRDVARKEAPVLAVPGLLRRCTGKRRRSNLDRVRLRRRRNRRHLVLLGERRRGQRTTSLRCSSQ